MAPNQWFGFAVQVNNLYWDSAYVIAHRASEMARGRMSALEMQAMMAEKPFAFLSSVTSGSGAMMVGSNPVEVARSAMAPYGKRAGQNARRLGGKRVRSRIA